jgi:uncharacterized protein DUF998
MESLLPTKLMSPRLHSTVVQRGELLVRLDAGLTKKLIVVTAPTGFGKTTLIRAWIASHDFPSAWVTLDENDNDPPRFWTYIVSALRDFDSFLGKTALSALRTTQPPSFASLLTSLINDLTRLKEPCLLVLEDYHAITLKEIHEGVSFLIQHLPESLHLVLITRTDPDLPLPILRARDDLVEINATDLRFISEYELGSFGWLMRLAFLALAVSLASAGVMIFPQIRTIVGYIGLGVLVLGVVGLLIAAAFKTDPITTSPEDLTFSGKLHVLGASLDYSPVAFLLLSLSLVRNQAWRPIRKWLFFTAGISLILTFGFILMLPPDGAFGPGVFTGLVGRFLVVSYSGWIATAAFYVLNRHKQQK